VNAPYEPQRVYTPTPLHIGPGQALSVPQSLQQPPAYVIVQQAAPEPSWARQHGGQIACAAGAGILVIAILLAAAIVAVAVGVAATGCAVGWATIKTLSKKIEEK
jgi:hypothetical protein